MADTESAPTWMHPLPEAPLPLTQAFDACVEACRFHPAPELLCEQCLIEESQNRIRAAARLAGAGKAPEFEDFGHIFFEHPNCVGGADTIKLFLPHGLKNLMGYKPYTGVCSIDYPEVIDTMLRAGFWFWPPDLIAPVRVLAARLFHDWFVEGRLNWLTSDEICDDLPGLGPNILELCIACLIDPMVLIQRLSDLHTPQADSVLKTTDGFTPETPFYLSVETGAEVQPYKPACDAIAISLAAREAQALLKYVTPNWLQQAFFRNETRHPKLAAELSKLENFYQVHSVYAQKAAKNDILLNWPDLPLV